MSGLEPTPGALCERDGGDLRLSDLEATVDSIGQRVVALDYENGEVRAELERRDRLSSVYSEHFLGLGSDVRYLLDDGSQTADYKVEVIEGRLETLIRTLDEVARGQVSLRGEVADLREQLAHATSASAADAVIEASRPLSSPSAGSAPPRVLGVPFPRGPRFCR